ncbi:MAG: YebC/PmpR family DNA-binding transcriptional regulator [Phycisphaeraceae bacterium]|nr:YebC/PmpR family DNA-binding transcriptional regulator [Phycisphaeraceae bacterium]
MSGHSKWANIKHRKARQDSKRSKIWSKCARAIIVAAKNGGGDPDANLTLRYAIDEAKAANMPKDTIENAVKKGSGELGTAHYESAIYEGYGPNGVAVLLDILTDNRNRTAGEIRKIFDKSGGNLGASGCVAYVFAVKGEMFVSKKAADEDAIMAVALDAGAEDVKDDGDVWQVLCEPSSFIAVRNAVQGAGIAIESSGINKIPSTTVACTGRDAERVMNLVDQLEDHDDVQKVYANFDIADDVLAALGNG